MFKTAIVFLMTLSIVSVDKKPGYIFRLNDSFYLFVLSHEEEQFAEILKSLKVLIHKEELEITSVFS